MVVAELTTGSGKSVMMRCLAILLADALKDFKIVLCVPHDYLLRRMITEFSGQALSIHEEKDLANPNKKGLFAIVNKSLAKTNFPWSQSILLLDEADSSLFVGKFQRMMHLAKGVIGLSASFGGQRGFQRLGYFYDTAFKITQFS